MLSLMASQGRKMLTASGCAYSFVCLCSCPWMPFDPMIAGHGQTRVADSLKKTKNEYSDSASGRRCATIRLPLRAYGKTITLRSALPASMASMASLICPSG